MTGAAAGVVGEMPGRIAVTGAAGFIGGHLLARLQENPDVELIVAADRAAIPGIRETQGPASKIVPVRRDIREPLHDVFLANRVEAVIHLAHLLRPDRDRERARAINVGGTATLLAACRKAGVRRVVYLSSGTVYGAWPSFTRPYAEDDPARPLPGFQYAEDKVAAEKLVLEFGAERLERQSAVLRASIVAGNGARNFISDTLAMRFIPTPAGADPQMQILDVDDLCAAVLRLIETGFGGVFNVAGGDTVSWRSMIRMRGGRAIPVPGPLLSALTGATWALRLQSASPARGVDLIRYPWLVSTEKLTSYTGWKPAYTSVQALERSL